MSSEAAIYVDDEVETAAAPLRVAAGSDSSLMERQPQPQPPKQCGQGGDEFCEVGEPTNATGTTMLDGGEKNARQLRLIDRLFNKSCERRRAKFEALVEQEKLRSHNTLHKLTNGVLEEIRRSPKRKLPIKRHIAQTRVTFAQNRRIALLNEVIV